MRRKALAIVVSNLLTEIGFESAEKQALETLVEMLQSFITEVGGSSKSYCELAGRTEVLLGDVVMALVEMGAPCWDTGGGGGCDGLHVYSRRPMRTVLPPPPVGAAPKQPTILQAGTKRPHPPHIPPHLPPFPDPHAYIRTPTHKQPVTEYEAIRDRAACQKRDVERALTRFVAKTGDTHSLFLSEDTCAFPLIACKGSANPYLNALLPKDQVFEDEEEEEEQRQRRNNGTTGGASSKRSVVDGLLSSAASGTQQQQSPQHQSSNQQQQQGGTGAGGTVPQQAGAKGEEGGMAGKGAGGAQSSFGGGEGSSNEGDIIDSPYLRPVKLPKKRKTK
ncbi:transcription initiation factor TFIID subunit 8-like [Ischnura elegans]|uniref:transcription initiation factor TFIID subunit 8-like n=1 Tax=Ischnura elegans TaxID=197161 RepID=UPI001ED897B9|nr:transcription initiation factor TFIID subunit 8-like [Ischnura elegans]